MKAYYKPEVFDVQNETDAKAIILTPEGSTTDDRWVRETPFLAQDINSFISPTDRSLVLDFGCGIGRISKELILMSGCRVLGLDISQSMRALSINYVSSDRFSPVGKGMLENLVSKGLKVDACVSIWVLQHCPNVLEEIELIKSILKPGGHFYVLNNVNSAIPTDRGWLSDGINIQAVLEDNFAAVEFSKLPEEVTMKLLSELSFIGKLVNH
jgi:SAM-dependent methyltransferase